MNSRHRYLWSLPWVLALVGLAVPMVGSGFIGWPFVAGWLVLLLLIWWVRPLGGAGRAARLGTGVMVIGLLALPAKNTTHLEGSQHTRPTFRIVGLEELVDRLAAA